MSVCKKGRFLSSLCFLKSWAPIGRTGWGSCCIFLLADFGNCNAAGQVPAVSILTLICKNQVTDKHPTPPHPLVLLHVQNEARDCSEFRKPNACVCARMSTFRVRDSDFKTYICHTKGTLPFGPSLLCDPGGLEPWFLRWFSLVLRASICELNS